MDYINPASTPLKGVQCPNHTQEYIRLQPLMVIPNNSLTKRLKKNNSLSLNSSSKIPTKGRKELHHSLLPKTTFSLNFISLIFFKKQRPKPCPMSFPENHLQERYVIVIVKDHVIPSEP